MKSPLSRPIGFLPVLPLLCLAAPLYAQRQLEVLWPNSQSGPATVLANGWEITPAGRHIPLPGDMPMRMILAPDGKHLLVNTGGYHNHGIYVIDLATEKLVSQTEVRKTWTGMCLAADGRSLFLSGGNGDVDGRFRPILRATWDGAKVVMGEPLVPDVIERSHCFMSGFTADKDGGFYAINLQANLLFYFTGEPPAIKASAKVGYRPYGLAISPDGNRVAVSNWGEELITLLQAKTLLEPRKIKVGSHPNDLAFAPDGRLFVANSGSNSVSVVKGDRVVETIKTSLDPTDPVGSTPVALAISPDGKRLFVANADNNDVAVIDTSSDEESRVLGFIPTGWYPSSVAVSADGRKLYVGVGKGLHSGQNKEPSVHPGRILNGAVSIVDLPDAEQLQTYTAQVRANTPLAKKDEQLSAQQRDVLHDTFRKIKHVLFIIRENRTYDQVFGDMSDASGKRIGNGDPDIVMFGEKVTPNAHRLARQYVLLDNLYCNGEVSQDGHQWCNAAYATDFNQKAWINKYSGRGQPEADERLNASPAGYMWDNCRTHGLTYRSYGEFAQFVAAPNTPPVFTGNKGLEGHASEKWNKKQGRDPQRVEVFIEEMREAEKTGEWPQYMVMSLGEDHTRGLSPGAYTPVASVASNDQALGILVEAISHSKFWPQTAIFVIEDDAQNGHDHVDCHRTVGLVISPCCKRGVVDSTLYTTSSMVHTMELILGLPTMTQYDRGATPMYNSFAAQPQFVAYNNLAPQVDLNARNPLLDPEKKARGGRHKANAAHARADADDARDAVEALGPDDQRERDIEASAKMDFSDVDLADADELNGILWRALKPGIPEPAPVRGLIPGR